MIEDFMSVEERKSYQRPFKTKCELLILGPYKTFTCTDILMKMESVNRNLDFAKCVYMAQFQE